MNRFFTLIMAVGLGAVALAGCSSSTDPNDGGDMPGTPYPLPEPNQTDPDDTMLIFSHSGINAVTLDIAAGAKEIGMKLIGVTSIPHSSKVPSRHSCGKRLFELADVVIDTGAPLGDAGVHIEGLEDPVGATSTSVAIAVGQAINAATVEKLVERGVEPFVMVSPNTTDKARANVQNDRNYAELWRRLSAR